jgi:beta-1,4-mannosyltransferase
MSEGLEQEGWTVREFSPFRSPFRSADIWHWHWPEGQFTHSSAFGALARALAMVLLLWWARLRDIPVVWTAHNLGNHSERNLKIEKRFMRYFRTRVAGVHYLSDATRVEALIRFPELALKPSCVIPHGHYRPTLEAVGKSEARLAIGIGADSTVISFVGKISAYKGVRQLVEAFRQTPGDKLTLLIAGACSASEERYLRERANLDQRIVLMLRHLSAAEIAYAFGASDLAVLPYIKILNSGSAMMALSLNRPILVPSLGALPELRDAVGAEWVTCYSPPLSSSVLALAIERSAARNFEVADLRNFDWPVLSQRLSDWYRLEIGRRD